MVERFNNGLDQLSTQISNDFAKSVSADITNDLARNPQDAFSLVRMLNGNTNVPSEFPNSADFFSQGEHSFQAPSQQGTASQEQQAFGGESLHRRPGAEDPGSSTDRTPQAASDTSGGFWSGVTNAVSDVASTVSNDSNSDSSSGGGFWSTVGGIASDVLPFLSFL
ncbi:MAG TPA: hypothetical protein V6C69_00530 [Trichormus sp.]|jgi:hypothetical protein